MVIKLSGEYLAGAQSFGIDQPTIDRIAGELIAARQLGGEIAVVVGGDEPRDLWCLGAEVGDEIADGLLALLVERSMGDDDDGREGH